jgi:hypothetical protein
MRRGVEVKVGFLPLLALLFIALKLTHEIDWAWFWVLSPILLPFIIFAFWVVALFVLAICVSFFERQNFHRRLRDKHKETGD